MRKRLLLVLAAVVLVLLGVAAAVLVATTRKPPAGKLDTELTGVSLVAPTAPPPTAGPGMVWQVDQRCWPMFGGDPQRSLSRSDIHLGIPVRRPLWVRGLKNYIEYPPSYCDGVLYVNTFKGDTWAIDAKTGRVVWRRRGNGAKALDPRDRGPAPDRQLDRRHGDRARADATGTSSGSCAPTRRSSRPRRSSTGRPTSEPRTAGCSRSMPRRARSTGPTTPAGASTRARRSSATASASRPTPARSSACAAPTGSKLWSTYVKRDPIRYESFYASPSTDGERLYTISRSGTVRDALRSDRRGPLDASHQLDSATRRPRSTATASSSVASTARSTPSRRRPGRSSGGRTVGGRIIGAADRRRQPRLLLHARAEDLRRPRLRRQGRLADRDRQVLARDRDRARLLLHAQRHPDRLPRPVLAALTGLHERRVAPPPERRALEHVPGAAPGGGDGTVRAEPEPRPGAAAGGAGSHLVAELARAGRRRRPRTRARPARTCRCASPARPRWAAGRGAAGAACRRGRPRRRSRAFPARTAARRSAQMRCSASSGRATRSSYRSSR